MGAGEERLEGKNLQFPFWVTLSLRCLRSIQVEKMSRRVVYKPGVERKVLC